MSEFKASNGWYETKLGGVSSESGVNYLPRRGVEGAALFFREREDARLGRWRSKEHPEYLVYPTDDPDTIHMMDERDVLRLRWDRWECDGSYSLGAEVAEEYFVAHPPRKPWEGAEPGELWQLTVGPDDVSNALCLGNGWVFPDGRQWLLDDPYITSARRLYPEEDV